MQHSLIGWTHNTWNPWVGCDKVAPECAKCYIGREVRKQTDWQAPRPARGETKPLRQPWGEVYLTRTWRDPYTWEKELAGVDKGVKRVFTCSLSDFFHAKVDGRTFRGTGSMSSMGGHWIAEQYAQPSERLYAPLKDWWECTWREAAWQVIKDTRHLVYLVLTKRPERILNHLPKDWGQGYRNVWLGTSVGCNRTLSKIDLLRQVPVHPGAVRFVSAEPLLEDISENLDLTGIGWLIVGGESGSNPEYLWDANADWKKELAGEAGRRTMLLGWAQNLLKRARAADIPFFFKQVTAGRSGVGVDALGQTYNEYPEPPHGVWAPAQREQSDALELVVLP
jgi:protein gp37